MRKDLHRNPAKPPLRSQVQRNHWRARKPFWLHSHRDPGTPPPRSRPPRNHRDPTLSSPTALRFHVPNHLKMVGIFTNRSLHTPTRHRNPMTPPPRSRMLRNHRPNQLPKSTRFLNQIQPNNLTLFPFYLNHHQ